MAENHRRTVRDLRRGNRAAVLQRLYFQGPMSRQALGPATGLSSGSISNVVTELAAEGLVEEAGHVESDGGRPRTLLRVAPRAGYLIGIDIGETRVRAELFDLAMTELARCELPLTGGARDIDTVIAHTARSIAAVLEESGIAAEALTGIGVGVPGIVERTPDGAVVHGQTVGWDAVPLERLLRGATDLPPATAFHISNGTMALGQAEMWYGGGRGTTDAAIVLFGSGVGACIVTDGQIHGIDHGTPAEFGHLTVQVRGRTCRCGSRGCLEAYTGAQAILSRWHEAGGPDPAEATEEYGISRLLAAARPELEGAEADPTALAILDDTAEYLAAGLADLVNLFQPQRILIGGWAGLQLGPLVLDTIRERTRGYALHHPGRHTEITLSTLGPDAITQGAATLPLNHLLHHTTTAQPPVPAERLPR
ncbi:ROK family transcriptional regulator [Streptomyces koyangensis]|uniref:ROK family transcriptional regulator n=1 Tax=Streptomyces koyangensis TaxID=188770 RepID=UPI003C2FD3DD